MGVKPLLADPVIMPGASCGLSSEAESDVDSHEKSSCASAMARNAETYSQYVI